MSANRHAQACGAPQSRHRDRGPPSGFRVNVRILNRLLGGTPAGGGELFNQLFVEPEFVEAGSRSARPTPAGDGQGRVPWRTGRL